MLSQGRGSLEYARDLLASVSDPQTELPEPENEEDWWCICRVCRRMQDEQEKSMLPEKNVCHFVCHVQQHLFGQGGFRVGHQGQM